MGNQRLPVQCGPIVGAGPTLVRCQGHQGFLPQPRVPGALAFMPPLHTMARPSRRHILVIESTSPDSCPDAFLLFSFCRSDMSSEREPRSLHGQLSLISAPMSHLQRPFPWAPADTCTSPHIIFFPSRLIIRKDLSSFCVHCPCSRI